MEWNAGLAVVVVVVVLLRAVQLLVGLFWLHVLPQ